MASAAVESAMNLPDQQNIHPFFAKPHGHQASKHANEPDPTPTDAVPHDENQTNIDEAPKKSQGKGRPLATRTRTTKRKSDEQHAVPKVKQASIAAFAGLKTEAGRPGDVSEATSLEEDPNIGRRKRPRTESPAPGISLQDTAENGNGDLREDQQSWKEQLEIEAGREPEQVEVKASSPSTSGKQLNLGDSDIVPATSPAPRDSVNETNGTPVPPSSPPVVHSSPAKTQRNPKETATNDPPSPSKHSPPKKMLRLNAKGRFSSPPSKETKEEAPTSTNQRKTRSRANKKAPKQLIVKISYITDDERAVQIAEDIDEILAGAKRAPHPRASVPSKATTAPKTAKPCGPPKPTHPFFTGKPQRQDMDHAGLNQSVATKPATAPERIPSRRETAITPGKLRAQARAGHEDSEFSNFGMFGASTKPRKVLGGLDAPWPWKGIARVSGDAGHDVAMGLSPNPSDLLPFEERRKFKGIEYQVPYAEAVLSLATHELQIGTSLYEDAKADCNNIVRFPQRLLSTGPEIQRGVHSEILSLRQHPSAPRIQGMDQLISDEKLDHPALADLFERIPNELTPFDEGNCETLSWTQKYAPNCAANVLGSSLEVSALREWLETLKVNSVGGALKESAAKSRRGGATKPPKKKRKKDELDDFIIDAENDLSDWGGLDGGKRISNLMLLTGPHGCGKTATVFAVAKELGFEVFEINSGSRRSGKDVLEKIGDMTENHLVQRQAQEHSNQAAIDSESERLTDAVQKDIESGRQKSMSSFFRPVTQAQAKPKVVGKKEVAARATDKGTQPTLTKPKKSQKQSLILLEEVDVLFEDDKNFWQTVEHLAMHSRRPVVMTCTNESLVRINQDSLHANLYMSPASTDLATDYLLLLAAKEGHLLFRQTVSNLYESKGCDLRATIMDLDFWCQMAVGDRKGGLEWMYQRWPPGKDIDEHGQVLRVASKDTYQTGMGWVERDVLLDEDHVGFDREYELTLELVESWNIEPEVFSSVTTPNHPTDTQHSHRKTNLKALQDMDRLIDLSSAVDMYCRVDVPTRSKTTMDPTQPPLPEKARTNYIDGYSFLQADTMIDFTNLDTQLAVSSHLAARRCIVASSTLPATESSAFDECNIPKTILAHIASARQPRSLGRNDFFVFDALAEPPTATLTSAASTGMTASSFDRTFRLLTEELAPYVRSIASHDLRLENERMRISSMLSAGGKPKRQRTTRAARSALEGGRRENTRRERWFDKSLNLVAAMRTAGKEWAGLGSGPTGEERDATETGSTRSRDGEAGSEAEMAL